MKLHISYPSLDKSVEVECDPMELVGNVAARAVDMMELPFPAMRWTLMVVTGADSSLVTHGDVAVGRHFHDGDEAEVFTLGGGV